MYFWKTHKLVEDIASNAITETGYKNYFIGGSLFYLLGYYMILLSPPSNMDALLVEAIGSVGIAIFGINWVFKANGGEEGKHFIKKITAIYFPLMIKFFVLSLAFGIICGVIGGIAEISEANFDWILTAFVLLVSVLAYWRAGVHMKNTNV